MPMTWEILKCHQKPLFKSLPKRWSLEKFSSFSRRRKRYGRAGAQLKGGEGEQETTSSDPGEAGIPARFRQTQDKSDANTAVSRRAADLSSGSDKSLVTATVRYPVSDSPARVDLSQIPNVYGTGGGDNAGGGSGGTGDTGQGTGGPDTDRIKLYEAENRALFWILISFLLILLILFVIFLCCVYCPWCWLYGHCYSKGDKNSREHSGRNLLIENRRRSDPQVRHKPYPEKMEDEEADYDREGFPRPPPARGHRHQRREAWSGEERKGAWRTSQQSPRSIRRYRGTPPPRSRKVGPQPHETDVALEDWEFDPGPPRPRDQAEEIGSRWQLQQQQQQQPQMSMQPGTMMPIPVAVPVQPPRRVAFGHPGQVDDAYMRRSQDAYLAEENQVQRAGYVMPRQVQSLPPGPDERAVSHLQPRKTRFFRTETGEVLQFGDYDGDEGKDLLIKRYIDEQQPKDSDFQQQQSFGSQHRQHTPGVVLSQPRLDVAARGNEASVYESQRHADQQGPSVDRPKAAIVSRRHQKNVSLSKDVTFDDEDDVEPTGRRKANEPGSPQKRSNAKKSKSTRQSESESDGGIRRNGDKDDDGQINRRKRGTDYDKRHIAKSPTPPTEDDDSRRSRSPSRRHGKDKNVSKSPSRSKTRSESPQRYKSKSKSPSRSKSRTRSRSASPPPPVSDREKRRAKAKQQQQQTVEKEGKQQRLKRHHHIQQHPSKGSKEDYEREREHNKEHRSHHHHHRVKHKESKQQQSFKDSREEMSRGKSKSLEPSLTSLPQSIDETEPPDGIDATSKENVKTSTEAVLLESTSDVREQSPPSVDDLDSRGKRGRRRSSVVFRQSSEDATQMESMVDINIIPPSSAMTDSSNNPRDADGMMSDGAPPTPDADGDFGAQQPETTISTAEKDGIDYNERLDGDDEETGAIVVEAESHSPERKRTDDDGDDIGATTVGGERSGIERMDTIPEPEKLENETIASQSTLDIAEAEAAAAAVAPNDSVENPPPGDDAEPDRSLDKKGPDEDDDSGIGMVGYLSRRNKMLEKKSVFTIAYDEVAQSTMMRPDTRGSTGETENEMPTAVK